MPDPRPGPPSPVPDTILCPLESIQTCRMPTKHKWDVCGVGRGGAPHFPISVQSHVSRKTGYSWSHSIDGSMTFLSPCTYHSEVTVPCWHCHKLSLTQVIAHPGSSEPDFPPPPCKSYTCSRVCLQHGCPTTLYTDIMSFVVPTICCCLSTQ